MKKTIKTFILLAVFAFGSMGLQASAQTPAPFPSASASLISRVGSLALSALPTEAALNSAFFKPMVSPLYANRCERAGNTASAVESCLDVNGSASFSDLFTYNLKAFVQNKTFVGPAAGIGPGAQSTALHVADTGSGQDSIMVSDLGRFNGSDQFEPKDKTTLRGVCADANGELFDCDIPEAIPTVCPLTATDDRDNKIYPIVDVNGTCWFGEDLEHSELTASEVDEFEKASGMTFWGPFNPATTYTNTNHKYPTGITFSFSDISALEAKCNALLSGTLDEMVVVGYGTTTAKVPTFELTCKDESYTEIVTKQYYYPNGGTAFDTNPGKYYATNMVDANVCPTGWHVPTDAQWQEAETFMGMANPGDFTNSYYSSLGTTGRIANSNTTGSHIDRHILATLPKLLELDFTPEDTYFSRERVEVQHGHGGWGATGNHMRSFYADGSYIDVNRYPLENHMNTSFVMSPQAKIFAHVSNFFVKKVHAFVNGLHKGLVRCVQGTESVNRVIGGWGTCHDTAAGAPWGPVYKQFRTVTCRIGTYPVHIDHCTEAFGLTATERSCVPAGGGGGRGEEVRGR